MEDERPASEPVEREASEPVAPPAELQRFEEDNSEDVEEPKPVEATPEEKQSQ